MKSAKFVSALAVTALLGGAVAAVAQSGPGPERPAPRGGFGQMMGPMGLGWAAADTNGDGQVTSDEADAALKARFAGADDNGDGQLSAEELAAAFKAMEEAAADARRLEQAKRLIDRADDNGDGAASADELRLPRGASDFVARFDTDGDGTVTKAEYDAKIKAQHERMRERHGKPGKDHARGERHGKGHPKGDRDEQRPR